MEVSRGVHPWYHFSNWSGPPSKKRIRAKRLLAKAADALVRREAIPFDREVQEAFDTLQLNESIPYVSIEYIKKAIKAERGKRLVGAGNRQKFVGLGGQHTEQMCHWSGVERRRHWRSCRTTISQETSPESLASLSTSVRSGLPGDKSSKTGEGETGEFLKKTSLRSQGP